MALKRIPPSLVVSDQDSEETLEWIESLIALIETQGVPRTQELLTKVLEYARHARIPLEARPYTAYVNTIDTDYQTPSPGDHELERKIRSLIRWNAMAMVVRTNMESSELGGHIASFASIATLYDVGFNHFWRAPTPDHGGDLIYLQGHSAPGIYARSFLEGRITEQQLDGFRQEIEGGLSSYPHPWLMPDYWQFPTVSMGLGPLQAIHQARYMRYLHNRDIKDIGDRQVWAFLGDGEMDEPESLSGLALAGREKLGNLVFVVNCNLQRLDGPVRGNGKIIQELEGIFNGAGWNVIKVIWGSYWDPLLEADDTGLLRKLMDEFLDGDYQTLRAKSGSYIREHFFGQYPQLVKLVEHLSDQQIWRLNRGGHDPHKVYAAYKAAMETTDRPTVILAKTIKGYGMGEAGEAQNITHQKKKMSREQILHYRTRFDIPLLDDQVGEIPPYYKPPEDSEEMRYLRERRERLGGSLPQRRRQSAPLEVPDLSQFSAVTEGSSGRPISTTMAFVRLLTTLTRDPKIGKKIVPIVPDESRTFGMEGLFRQLGIYAPSGQLYTPEDSEQLMFYKEDKNGQVLQEGINEAGAMCSWIAAATSYSNHDCATIPFYIFYSMFGFQRIGDLCWAAGDIRARGFLIGATAGKTTLAGEGLQHQDGHSHLISSTVPNCVSYDPCYAYELAVIIADGLKRMMVEQEDVYYYLTCMNENYVQPPMPQGCEKDIIRGLYALKKTPKPAVDLVGSGTILRNVLEAAQLLKQDFGLNTNVWSATSLTELAREGNECQQYNMLNPSRKPRTAFVSQCLDKVACPVVVATDYVRLYGEQIRAHLSSPMVVLGTDGFGRSDSREKLRHHFGVSPGHIVVAALGSLHQQQKISAKKLNDAIARYQLNTQTEHFLLR